MGTQKKVGISKVRREDVSTGTHMIQLLAMHAMCCVDICCVLECILKWSELLLDWSERSKLKPQSLYKLWSRCPRVLSRASHSKFPPRDFDQNCPEASFGCEIHCQPLYHRHKLALPCEQCLSRKVLKKGLASHRKSSSYQESYLGVWKAFIFVSLCTEYLLNSH